MVAELDASIIISCNMLYSNYFTKYKERSAGDNCNCVCWGGSIKKRDAGRLEEGGSCCGHRTGLPHNGGGEKGPEVIIDDQLTFTDHIASVSRSCRFALFNTRKIRPYLTQYATQLLVQTLVNSRLDYCNALLSGLPACVVK